MQGGVMGFSQAALAPFCILSSLPSMLPWFSLHVQQHPGESSAIMKMLYICTDQYNSLQRKMLFKFIKTKLKIQFILHMASDY